MYNANVCIDACVIWKSSSWYEEEAGAVELRRHVGKCCLYLKYMYKNSHTHRYSPLYNRLVCYCSILPCVSVRRFSGRVGVCVCKCRRFSLFVLIAKRFLSFSETDDKSADLLR